MLKGKVNSKIAKEVFIYVALLFVLLLASININNFLKPKQINSALGDKVLGIETENKEEAFWQDFLTKNPNYIPGWIEIGNTDRVLSIDPNYEVRP